MLERPPILDFKDLYGWAEAHRIVVVERAGYGYSEDTSESRDVSEVLSETRQALAKAHVSVLYNPFSFDVLLRRHFCGRKIP